MRSALSAVILYTADRADEDGRALHEKHRVSPLPTFLLLNPEGETLSSWVGYGRDEFLSSLAVALADPTTLEEKKARFVTEPSVDLAVRLAEHCGAFSETEEALRYYRTAQRLNTDPEQDYLLECFDTVFAGFRDSVFTPSDVERAADAIVDSFSNVDDLVTLGRRITWYVDLTQDTLTAGRCIEAAVRATADNEDACADQSRRYLMVDYALLVKKDRLLALDYRRKALDEGWEDNHIDLLFFSLWCYEQGVNLDEARGHAERALDLVEAEEDINPRMVPMVAHLARDIALEVGDTTAAHGFHRRSLSGGWQDDADQLNRMAWWCFEHQTGLDEAEEFARRGVDLAEPGEQRARILDTLAELINLRGETREALTLIQEAAREAPDDLYHQEQLIRFEALVAKEN